MVVSLFILIPNVINICPLSEYANRVRYRYYLFYYIEHNIRILLFFFQIVETRRTDAPHLLPELLEHYPSDCEAAKKVPHALIDQLAVCESLKAAGMDPTRLQQFSPYGAGAAGPLSGGPGHHHRHSWVEVTARGSVVDIGNGPPDVDSISSSPGLPRVSFCYFVFL